MPDRYKFSVKLDFSFEIPGVKNPDMREKLREEAVKALYTLLQAEPNSLLYAYPVKVEGKEMIVSTYLGFMGTIHAPNRFRSKDILSLDLWSP